MGGDKYKPISEVFHTLRPDLVLVDQNSRTVNTLELTVYHETNLQKSKQYKIDKYERLFNYLTIKYCTFTVHSETVETSSLGFISDITHFCKTNLTNCLPEIVRDKIFTSITSDSFMIYCNRNKNAAMDVK